MNSLQTTLRALAYPEQAQQYSRFFKTGPGQYGEGDHFLGIKMPVLRTWAQANRETALLQLAPLLSSEYHEERMAALLIVQLQYKRSRTAEMRQICIDFLLQHIKAMNNWDLVDVIVPGTLGDWIWRNPVEERLLWNWIGSETLWERRIAVMATFAQIRKDRYELTLQLCEVQLKTGKPMHDLMQKANGWMLREIGKRDLQVLLDFLDTWAAHLPRTMLRYAIEKLPEAQRQGYLKRRS
jgi:3-methyladenine DNA glycosylase AlkD